MKKIILLVVLTLSLLLLFGGPLFPENRDDYQVIKKAVKDNPGVEPAKEARWFKILVTDNKTGKEKVKVTMPLTLVEIFARCADSKELRMGKYQGGLNLQELLAELKKVGPLAIIEINEEDETVKVWLE